MIRLVVFSLLLLWPSLAGAWAKLVSAIPVRATSVFAAPVQQSFDGQAPYDLGKRMVGAWSFDEVSGIRVNRGTCGADCNLNDNATVQSDAVNYTEGTRAALFTDADGDFLSCTHAVCGDELGIAGSVTYGCKIRKTIDDTSASYIFSKLTGSAGYRMTRDNDNDRVTCTAGNGTVAADSTAINSVLVNTWYHVACRFDDEAGSATEDELEAFIDAGGTGSPASLTSLTVGATTFTMSLSSLGLDGQVDDCFVSASAMSDQSLCFHCSCSGNAEACTCDADNPLAYKACTVDSDCQGAGRTAARCDTTNGTCSGWNTGGNPGCGGCTLPACDFWPTVL